MNITTPAADNINHPKESIVSIYGGAGTSNKFYSIYKINVHKAIGAEASRVIDRLIHAMAIYQQKCSGTVITKAVKTAHIYIIVFSIIGHIKAADSADEIT